MVPLPMVEEGYDSQETPLVRRKPPTRREAAISECVLENSKDSKEKDDGLDNIVEDVPAQCQFNNIQSTVANEKNTFSLPKQGARKKDKDQDHRIAPGPARPSSNDPKGQATAGPIVALEADDDDFTEQPPKSIQRKNVVSAPASSSKKRKKKESAKRLITKTYVKRKKWLS